jgi:hypothetical protein
MVVATATPDEYRACMRSLWGVEPQKTEIILAEVAKGNLVLFRISVD